MWLIIPLIFIASLAHAQTAYIKDGAVYAGDREYCKYTESGKKIYKTTVGASADNQYILRFPDACGDDFKNIAFGSDIQPNLITATAKVLATAYEPYMVYYYTICFEPIDRELNVRYHPMIIREFVRDMVKYDVVKSSFINEKNALTLLDKWQKKSSILAPSYIAKGVATNYNSKDGIDNRKQSINVVVNGNKVYKDSNWIATYELDKHIGTGNLLGTTKESKLYRIKDTVGNLMALVKAPQTRSVFFLLPAREKESLSVVTTDKDEEKIIASAVKVLLVHSKK